MASDLLTLSAAELLRLYRAKRASPVEVTRAVLQRIDGLNPVLNAFCFVAPDALEVATTSEARWMTGAPRGALDGVPVSIKDLLLTRGWPTLRGSKTVDPKGPWNDDAPVVARLREADAVIVGKTTTPEFGWKGVTDNPLTGITRNPWNPAKTPGGSSGGAAAAIAAGMGPLTLGTDGGGSIRIPCAFTGVFGLKPSFGRVPAWPLSPFGTVAHVGPMTRSVHDAALMLNVLSQPDARDAAPGVPGGALVECGRATPLRAAAPARDTRVRDQADWPACGPGTTHAWRLRRPRESRSTSARRGPSSGRGRNSR